MRPDACTHLRALYHLPSWQGGAIVHAACQAVRFGAPERRYPRLTCEVADVNCPRCEAILAQLIEPERNAA